jgi:hypothetical protein
MSKRISGMTIATAPARLLNPTTHDGSEFDPETQRVVRATIDWFEANGKARLLADTHTDEWHSDFIEFLARERVFVTFADAGARRRQCGPQAPGHGAQSCAQRDPRVLPAALLVCVAGDDPRPRADLAERQARARARAGRPWTTARYSRSAYGEREHGADKSHRDCYEAIRAHATPFFADH